MLSKYSLLIYSPGLRVSLCRPNNNVEFSRNAEKSISNELSTAKMHILASSGYAPGTIAVNSHG